MRKYIVVNKKQEKIYFTYYRWENEGNSFKEMLFKEEMKKTANELLDSMQDTRFSETEFLNFVETLKSKSQYKETTDEDQLLDNAFKDAQESNIASLESNRWVDEFEKISVESKYKNSFWDNLSDEWNLASKYYFK